MKAWGSSSENKGSCENGLEVSITYTLFDALRRLRRRRQPRAIWAGAICINQRDDEERSELVALMGTIVLREATSSVLFMEAQ